jgi:hypothetical protein
LIHSFAKIISKAMEARLAIHLPQLVDCNQSAFVKGRAIQDNFFMIKHSIQALHKKRSPVLMLKLDTAKAFDSVAWSFLFEVMRHRGFGPKWLARVALLLSRSSTHVLVNGQAGDQFWHARGLRQGNPCSPMIFVLIFNTLNGIFRIAEEAGVFEPLTRFGIKHHLSFADDVVLLIKPSVQEATAAVELLRVFGNASGLHCNLAKSSVSPIRCGDVDLQPIISILGCPVQHFPIQYLGLPLSVNHLSKADLQPLVDKITRSVPAWTAVLMKKSGRLVYINAKLASSSIYHMLSLDLPPWFFNTANKLLQGFFWSPTLEAKKGHCMVAWDTVCSPKEIGGLGIKNLKLLNHALRMCWRWLTLADADKPWHGLEFEIAKEAKEMFQSCTKYKVGNGQIMCYWTNKWIQGRSIEEIAPHLMGFVRPGAKTATVAMALQNNQWVAEIRGSTSIPALVEFMEVWELLQGSI